MMAAQMSKNFVRLLVALVVVAALVFGIWSLRRGLDVVEFACGIPSQLMGQALTDISRNVDCQAIREPVGVVVGIPPFNFSALIPLWMMSVGDNTTGTVSVNRPSASVPVGRLAP